MAIVYRHIRLDTNTPFYIGIGQDEKRAYTNNGRNKHWHNIVNKTGYKVQIMLDDLTYEEAKQKEIEFIQLYGRADLGLGTLVNKTDGGDGILGFKHTKETIAKMRKPLSEEHKAKVSAALTGKKHSEETKAKISTASKNISAETRAKRSAALTGKKRSEEYVAKMSAALTGKKRSEETRAKIGATMKAIWAERKL